MSLPEENQCIVITGASCRFAETRSPDVFWRHTLAKQSLLSPCASAHELWARAEAIGLPWLCPPRRIGALDALYGYDPDILNLPDGAAGVLSPDALFGTQLAVEALRDAGLNTKTLPVEGVAVHVGYAQPFAPAVEAALQHFHGVDQMVALVRNLAPGAGEEQLAALAEYLRKGLPELAPPSVRNAFAHTLAAEISAALGCAGPARVAPDGAVAFLAALRAAVDDLQAGRAEIALVGAVQPPFSTASLLTVSAWSEVSRHDIPQALCRGADGMVPGEGAAFFVLQRHDTCAQPVFAKQVPYAVVRGVALASGTALEEKYAHECGVSLARALTAALAEAGAAPHRIGYVEAHGSGVPREDDAELEAFAHCLAQDTQVASPIAVGTAKPVFGHTYAAAGAAGMLRAMLALRHRILPPTLVSGKPHAMFAQQHVPLYLPEEPHPWVTGAGPRLAGLTAMDPSGLYAHAILEEFPMS